MERRKERGDPPGPPHHFRGSPVRVPPSPPPGAVRACSSAAPGRVRYQPGFGTGPLGADVALC